MSDDIDVRVVDAESDPAVKIIRLQGVLEARNIAAISKVVLPLIEAGCVRLAFDCSGLTYVNSPALGIFVNFYRKTDAKGGDAKFFGLGDHVLEVFRIVGLTKTLNIYPDEESAVAAFDSR